MVDALHELNGKLRVDKCKNVLFQAMSSFNKLWDFLNIDGGDQISQVDVLEGLSALLKFRVPQTFVNDLFQYDKDKDGKLSLKEFENSILNNEFVSLFKI
jgi:Ca2+-binding EF-hand superfamily protein